MIDIAIAAIGLIGTIVASVFAYMGAKHAREVNNSVNHRGGNQRTLYQLAVDNNQSIARLDTRVDRVEVSVGELKKNLKAPDHPR